MRWLSFILILAAVGCGARSDRIDPARGDVIFLVHGAGGATREYQALIDGLRDAPVGRPVQIVSWGAPLPLFFLNFSNAGVHDAAEKSFATRLRDWRDKHPNARIDIIAHSAGCGVTLGALEQLPRDSVHTVVMLHPSVSPYYSLDRAADSASHRMHAFVSDRDKLFLHWRTSTFGTYDNVKTPAAGHQGFEHLPPRVVQHRYDAAWNALGHDGEHFGCLSRRFAQQIIAPLLAAQPAPLALSQSSVANPR